MRTSLLFPNDIRNVQSPLAKIRFKIRAFLINFRFAFPRTTILTCRFQTFCEIESEIDINSTIFVIKIQTSNTINRWIWSPRTQYQCQSLFPNQTIPILTLLCLASINSYRITPIDILSFETETKWSLVTIEIENNIAS